MGLTMAGMQFNTGLNGAFHAQRQNIVRRLSRQKTIPSLCLHGDSWAKRVSALLFLVPKKWETWAGSKNEHCCVHVTDHRLTGWLAELVVRLFFFFFLFSFDDLCLYTGRQRATC